MQWIQINATKVPIRTKIKTNQPSVHLSKVVCQAGFGFGKAASSKVPSVKSQCPCGSGQSYKDCCKKYHDGAALPETAEQLMRSRYSAYANGVPQWVIDTTHPENPLHPDTIEADSKQNLKDDVLATIKKISWEKLKILSNEPGVDDNEAYVTFQTWFKVKGQQGQRAQGFHTQSFIEKSRFLRTDGRWLYVNGEQNWDVKI